MELKKMLRPIVLLAGVIVTLYQMAEMMDNWQRRPFEVVEDWVPADELPFPSVTVCPEGSTLWSGLRRLMSAARLSWNNFPKSYVSYSRTRLYYIEKHFLAHFNKLIIKIKHLCRGSVVTADTIHPVFCQFSSVVLRHVGQLVSKGELEAVTERLHARLAGEVGILTSEEVGELKRQGNMYVISTEMSFHERLTVRYGQVKQVTIKDYLNLRLLEFIVAKSRNGSLDMFHYFQKSLFSCDSCTFAAHNKSDAADVSSKMKSYQYFSKLVTEDMIGKFRQKWMLNYDIGTNHSLSTVAASIKGVSDYERLLLNLFSVFNKFVYVNRFPQHEGQIEDVLIRVMKFPIMQHLPAKTVIQYTEEIDENLAGLMGKLLGSGEAAPWSLPDLLSMMTTVGREALLQKARWNRNRGRTSLQALNLRSNITWSSLSALDETCLLDAVDFSSPSHLCQKSECQELCHKAEKLLAGSNQGSWRHILINTVQQPVFLPKTDNNVAEAPLVPFCFQGENLSDLLDHIKRGKNFPYDTVDPGLYSHCQNVRYQITDDGMCATYNLPSYKMYRKPFRDVMKQYQEGESEGRPVYPSEVEADEFENGLLLILDSWAVGGYKIHRRDQEGRSSPKGTLIETRNLNGFRIIIHQSHQVPVHHSYDAESIFLAPSLLEEKQKSVIVYKILLNADLTGAEKEVMSKDVARRECMFPEESDKLSYFAFYDKYNCLFECKLSLAKAKCGCLPWLYAYDNTTTVCGIVGNLCFQQEMVRLKKHLKNEAGIGSPPCGCYNSCKNVNYWVSETNVGTDSHGWLDINGLSRLGITRTNYTAIHEKIKNAHLKQFLVRYLLDYFNRSRDFGALQENDGQMLSNNEFIADFQRRAENLALVFIDLGDSEFRRYKMTIRVSLPDMLSAIGGTLSLFTGFSLVVIIDICIWAQTRFGRRKGPGIGPDDSVLMSRFDGLQKRVDRTERAVSQMALMLHGRKGRSHPQD